jgi:hypothetical protein
LVESAPSAADLRLRHIGLKGKKLRYPAKRLWSSHIEKINLERNKIAHCGEFRSKSVAHKIMVRTYEALKVIMDIYEHESEFKEFET